MKFKTALLAMASSVMMMPAANAAGVIVVDPIVGGVRPVVVPQPIPRPGHPVGRINHRPTMLKGAVSFGLRMQAEEVKVEITDQVAKTYIVQTFVNDTDQNLAGTYLFPLPEDTTFSSFSLHIDGKAVEGKILAAADARAQYEEIVRRMVDPGLLEYADQNTVRARIFPIPAHGTKKVELEYTQVLKAENGMIKYRFPLKGDEGASTEDVNIGVKLASKSGIRAIWSPSHVVGAKRENDHKAQISFAAKDAVLDKDFVLYYSVSDKDMAANLLTHRKVDEDGYFLLTLTPPVEAKQVIAKDIILVADTSGSMKGERMEQTKKALKYLVNAFTPNDRFSIVRFSTDVDSFRTEAVPATPENKKAAIEFINDMEPAGGTNIGDALKTAGTILQAHTERPAYLVLMTDGEPTVGETSVAGLLKCINPKRDIRVFDFGVGYDLNTKLLNKLAEDNHGTSQYVEPNENIETELSNFYDKIKAPVLSNVKIAYQGVTVKDIYPRETKDIFAGSQVMLMGRYKNSGPATVQVTGTVNGVAKAYSFPLKFEETQAGHTYLPRVWAMRRIHHLTEVAQDNGNNKEVVDEIVDLSKKYGIISAYTSFLVTDPSENQRLVNRPVTPMPMMQTDGTRMAIPRVRRGSAGAAGGPTGFISAVPPSPVSAGAGSAPVSGRLMAKTKGGSYSAREIQVFDSRPTVHDLRTDGAMASARQNLPPTSMGKLVRTPGDSMYAAGAGDEGVSFGMAMGAASSEVGARLQSAQISGEQAVRQAKAMNRFRDAVAYESRAEKKDADKKEESGQTVKVMDDKTFLFKSGFWVDSAYDPAKSPKPQTITFGSKEYFDVLKANPGISKYLSVGRQCIVIFGGKAYKVVFVADA